MSRGVRAQSINLIKWFAVKIVLFENISIKYLLMEKIILICFLYQLLNNIYIYINV